MNPTTTATRTSDRVVQERNYTVIRMVNHGFTTAAIMAATGFTHGQVQTRVSLYGLQGKRSDFRNGLSDEGMTALRRARQFTGAELRKNAEYYADVRANTLEAMRKARARNFVHK